MIIQKWKQKARALKQELHALILLPLAIAAVRRIAIPGSIVQILVAWGLGMMIARLFGVEML